MKSTKRIILGTTAQERALRVASLCFIVALSGFAIVALSIPSSEIESTADTTQETKTLKKSSAHSKSAHEKARDSRSPLDVTDAAKASNSADLKDVAVSTSEGKSTENSARVAEPEIVKVDPPHFPDTASPQQSSGQNSMLEPSEETKQTHLHRWIDTTETIHHDAVYENVWHEPVYEIRVDYHDVCVQCGAILDGGLAGEHLKNNPCSNFITGVPEAVKVLVSEGYSEQVLVQAAWDETVVVGKHCDCGAAV